VKRRADGAKNLGNQTMMLWNDAAMQSFSLLQKGNSEDVVELIPLEHPPRRALNFRGTNPSGILMFIFEDEMC